MDKRKYKFAIKFAVERNVVIVAEGLTDAMAKLFDVSTEMVLAEIDADEILFLPGKNHQEQTQVYPEHDFLYRCDDNGNEIEETDDRDEV